MRARHPEPRGQRRRPGETGHRMSAVSTHTRRVTIDEGRNGTRIQFETTSVDRWTDLRAMILFVRRLERAERDQLIRYCFARLRNEARSSRLHDSQPMGRLLIAMLPQSEPRLLRAVVRKPRSVAEADLRREIACRLLDAQTFRHGQRFRRKMRLCIGRVLCTSGTDRFGDVAVLGDVFGDAFPPNQCVPVLLNALTRTRNAAGRIASISGLKRALSLECCTPRQLRSIRSALERVANDDRSEAVRDLAATVLWAWRKYGASNTGFHTRIESVASKPRSTKS